jgi:tRNA(Ile)-lysidine synthase
VPPETLVERFRNDLTALIAIGSGASIGIAVSGGPDSLALLLLAHAGFPGRIVAASVNHGLRAEAADEIAMVARVCAMMGIPHAALSGRPLAAGGNIQERARILRYRLLAEWAAQAQVGVVATAHHRDDVAESFLMRAIRGSGVGGLARMKQRTPLPYASGNVVLVRPLLGWGREELAAIVRDAGITPAEDRSNDDDRFDRVRVRKLFAREPMLDPKALASAAAHLQDADTAIEWMVDFAWRSRVEPGTDSTIRLDPHDLPKEIRRRLCERAIVMLTPGWNGDGLDRIFAVLDRGSTATLAGVKCSGGAMWHFSVAPARRHHR